MVPDKCEKECEPEMNKTFDSFTKIQEIDSKQKVAESKGDYKTLAKLNKEMEEQVRKALSSVRDIVDCEMKCATGG